VRLASSPGQELSQADVKTRLEGHLTEAPHLTLIKQTAAAFAQDCWNEIPLEIVRATWDMDPSDQWQMMNWMMGRRPTLQTQMVTMVKDRSAISNVTMTALRLAT
jgi:hypothetical protein